MSVKVPLVLIVLLLAALPCARGIWIPASKVRTKLPLLFTEIYYPESAIVYSPKVGSYLIYQETMLGGYQEYCSMWQDRMQDEKIPDCSSYFCSNQFPHIYNNTSKTSLHVALHNYCTYCIVDDEVEYEIEERVRFMELLRQGQCPHFHPLDKSHCGDAEGYVMLYEPLFKKSSSPYICYCPTMDRYGYRCDAYTAFLIGFNFLGKHWIFFVFSIATALYILVVYTIPVVARRCHKWQRLLPYPQRRYTFSGLKLLFPLRVHVIGFTMLALLFLCAEQIIDILYSFAQYMDSLEPSVGYLRIVSFSLMSLGYSSMYIHWASEVERDQQIPKGLRVKYQVVLAFVQGSVLCGMVCLTILSPMMSNVWILSVLLYAIGLTYYGSIAIGFSIHSIRMALLFEKTKANRLVMQKLKLTRLVILANFCYIINFSVIALLSMGNIIGWDWLGKFVGLYRYFFIDAGICIVSVVVLAVSVRSTGKHVSFYRQLFNKCVQLGTLSALPAPSSVSAPVCLNLEDREESTFSQLSETHYGTNGAM